MGMLDQLKWLGGYTSEPEIDRSSANALQAAARDLQQISTDIVQDAAARKMRARLAVIEGLAVEQGQDEFLDKATRLVGTSLHAPISMVNLIGETQQISASVLGDLPRTLPLSHSTCRLVVDSELPLMITDARNDARVRDLPQVTELGLQAYLGFPITMQEGVCVGSLCAIDTEPHAWTQRDQEVLCGVRDMVTMLLEMKREINTMETRMRMHQIQQIARSEKPVDS